MTSLNLNHSLKSLSPNTVMLGIAASTHGLLGEHSSVHKANSVAATVVGDTFGNKTDYTLHGACILEGSDK